MTNQPRVNLQYYTNIESANLTETPEAQQDYQLPTSQYFVKFEVIPSPNETTEIEINKRYKFGTLLFIPIIILNIAVLAKGLTDGQNYTFIWMNVNVYLSIIYVMSVAIASIASIKLKNYADVLTSDVSIKFMQVCKIWIVYGFSHLLDMFLFVWGACGFAILVSNDFSSSRGLQIILGILSVTEYLYFLCVTPKL